MTSEAANMGGRAVGERPFPGLPEGTDTLPQIDHILVLIMENQWNLPALTRRDAAAADLCDFLDLDQPSFATPPTLAQPLAGATQLACEKTGPGQIPPPGSVTPG